MTRSAVTIAIAASTCLVGGALGAPPPTSNAPPASLRAGEPWTVSVRPTQPARARVEIRLGALREIFRLRRAGPASKARIVFPRPGTWVYGVRLGERFRRLGTARVRPAPLLLGEASDAVEVDGAIVISDRKSGVVHRLEPASGHHVVLARIRDARELEVLDDRSVLVSSENRILRLDARTGATEPVAEAAAYILGLARTADGGLVVSEDGSTIVRLDGHARRPVVAGRDGVHGLLATDGALIACEAFGGNVLEIELRSGSVRILGSGLRNPSSAVRTPRGALYVAEFGAGRIVSLDSDGTARPLAPLARVGSLSLGRDGWLVATSLDGRVVRVDPATGRLRDALP